MQKGGTHLIPHRPHRPPGERESRLCGLCDSRRANPRVERMARLGTDELKRQLEQAEHEA